MGDRAAQANYLLNVLNIPNAARVDAILDEGFDSLANIRELKPSDIKEICYNVKKPGGLNAAFLPNAGFSISMLVQKRLELHRAWVFHVHIIQRNWDAAAATLPVLQAFKDLTESFKETSDDVEKPAAFTAAHKYRDFIENLNDYLGQKVGAAGVPLIYLVRETVDLPDPADDPGLGQPTMIEEMTRRARHDGQCYATDLETLWSLLRMLIHNGPGWIWIKSFEHRKDGIGAYWAFVRYYMGPSHQAAIISKADKIIETSFYDGKKTYTFDKFCTRLAGAFLDQGPENQMSEEKKVTKLLKGIQAPALTHAKTQVMVTPNLKGNFQEAVNFIQEFVNVTEKSTDARSIAAIDKVKPGRGSNGGRGGGGRGPGNGKYKKPAFDPKNPGITPRSVSALQGDNDEGDSEPPSKKAKRDVSSFRTSTIGASMTRRPHPEDSSSSDSDSGSDSDSSDQDKQPKAQKQVKFSVPGHKRPRKS